jgi:NADPH2:quinone reductase
MRAAWYSSFGDADTVLKTGEMERPEAGLGEVLVRMAVSGVNPVDVKRRQGGRGEMEAPQVIPHFDGAGVIEAVGEGVDSGRVGERVWIYEAQWGSPLGCAAEYAVVPAARAIALPEGTELAAGACLGIPAITAHRAVFADGPVTGQTILVTGGAGAVGRYAIQFAKLGGARVLATVSSEAKGELSRSAGCDSVIDYRQEDVAARVGELTESAGVDRVVEVEMGGNLETSLAVLKVNGVIATYASEANPEPTLPFYPFLYKSVVLRHVLVFQIPEEGKTQATSDITRWMAEGQISHHIGESFKLADIVAAHQAVEGGAVGKVLVEVD